MTTETVEMLKHVIPWSAFWLAVGFAGAMGGPKKIRYGDQIYNGDGCEDENPQGNKTEQEKDLD